MDGDASKKSHLPEGYKICPVVAGDLTTVQVKPAFISWDSGLYAVRKIDENGAAAARMSDCCKMVGGGNAAFPITTLSVRS